MRRMLSHMLENTCFTIMQGPGKGQTQKGPRPKRPREPPPKRGGRRGWRHGTYTCTKPDRVARTRPAPELAVKMPREGEAQRSPGGPGGKSQPAEPEQAPAENKNHMRAHPDGAQKAPAKSRMQS